ncbi:MAG: hypothetical protein IKN57_03585 [Parasporobacterium sp.]|nr:hypothetical protein [Parasporobacterium sp.]
MEKYKHFQLASYMYAYYAAEADDEQIREGIRTYQKYLPLTKVYLENHRATTDVPVRRLKEIKSILEGSGIKVSGGITSTALIGNTQKPALFDTFCYTDPAHRKEYLRIVNEAAQVFDEIILDDYFFTSCRCEMCISAKGKRSWKDFRQAQMKEFSEEITAEAKRVNPHINFIIKYPNWYESHQAAGYCPGIQKDIFDMIYTGTETREPFYSSQHLQRYESYSAMRLLENAAPGRNGGGWIDLGGSSDNISRFLEQAEFTFLGGAKELTLFNFPSLLNSPALRAMDPLLRRVDAFLDHTGKPAGAAVWEPFDAEGEDQLCSYLGMCGAALELYPEFPENAPAVLLTQRAACRPEAMEKLEAYVRKGGKAIVTIGFFHEMYHQGIRDMTSVRLTHRHVTGSAYMIDRCDYDRAGIRYARGPEEIMIEALDYKTNATWADVLLLSGEDNFPILTEDFYGKGRLLILNIPENFADLYKLPADVAGILCGEIASGQPLYMASEPKWSLICSDNEVFCVHSFRPMLSQARVVVRGKCKGLLDLETGTVYQNAILLPAPHHRGDAALTRTALEEYAFDIPVGPGSSMYLKIRR